MTSRPEQRCVLCFLFTSLSASTSIFIDVRNAGNLLIWAPRVRHSATHFLTQVTTMDASSVSVLWYRRSKPLGKVRRRVQDLRNPSSCCTELLAIRPVLDLSHNESARLAVDCLLSRGLEDYHEVLTAEGEVDFLSELEKSYILENGRDGSTDEPGASGDKKDFESFSGGSWSGTRGPSVSTDSDPAASDVRWTGPALDRPSVAVYFQGDSRSAGMKDIVREFIRKANMVLAIVMDSFSDVELLCDLLEASRKRNVSVYLLLDDLNLNLFVSMWQDLKLNSKNFPKLSVRSVHGQTYCAKTGKKLTGQITESFIITDWTEVLTGSYSFSWLSWQVHRSIAVLVKGSAVTPFHQEFHRLYFSSKPVPGFVTFITVPRVLPLYTTSHATQNNNSDTCKSKSSQNKTTSHWPWTEDVQNTQTETKMPVLSSPQSPEEEQSKCDSEHRTGIDAQKPTEPPRLNPNPVFPHGTPCSVSVEKPKLPGVSALQGAQTCMELLEKIQNQIQRHCQDPNQTHASNAASQLASLAVCTTADKKARVQESYRPQRAVHYQSVWKNSSLDQVATEGLLFQQRNGNRQTKPLVVATGPSTQRELSLTLNPNVERQSDSRILLSPFTSQQKPANAGLHLLFSPSGRHPSALETKVSSLGRRHCQPPLQSHPAKDVPGLKSTSAGTFKPQFQTDSKLFSPGAGAKLHIQPQPSQQTKPPPRLNWMPQGHTARPRPVARTSSFDATYRTGQKLGGQFGWRPFNSNMTSLGRSKSLNE